MSETELNPRQNARDIVDIFEDVLDEYDITVPSPEDDEREEDNAARLYGSVYWSLVDAVEEYLKTIKSKPLPVEKYDKSSRIAACPVCSYALSPFMKFCSQCGQELIWEKDE